MSIEFLNILLTVAICLGYLFLQSRMLLPVLHRITNPMNPATGLLYIGALFGSGLLLYHFSDISTNALYFFVDQGDLTAGFGFVVLFSVISLVTSYVLFLISFFMMDRFTKENEKAELGKNNLILAGYHVVVYIVICLMVSKPLADMVNSFIDYPRFPD